MTHTKLFVFSATGTSLKVAEDIASHLENCEILSIPKIMRKTEWALEADNIGFVFPCYYGTLPRLVKEFILKANSIRAPYVFSVATAGRSVGYSHKTLEKLLVQKKSHLDYGEEIIVASNYMVGWYYTLFQPSDARLLQNAEIGREQCRKIAADIQSKVQQIKKPSVSGYLQPQIVTPNKYIKDTRAYDQEFEVTRDCTLCGVCEKVCPVNNITISNETITFGHNCQRCMACVQMCPQSAFVINGKPMNKKKYSHPNITLKDLVDFNG